jgi:hypothetical protein
MSALLIAAQLAARYWTQLFSVLYCGTARAFGQQRDVYARSKTQGLRPGSRIASLTLWALLLSYPLLEGVRYPPSMTSYSLLDLFQRLVYTQYDHIERPQTTSNSLAQ